MPEDTSLGRELHLVLPQTFINIHTVANGCQTFQVILNEHTLEAVSLPEDKVMGAIDMEQQQI
jgi:hypothetical protein